MKNIIKILVILTPLLFIACGSNSKKSENSIEGKLLLDISAKDMKTLLLSEGWPIEGYDVYGYRAYKIPYVTKDEKENDVNVSGLLVIPTELPSSLQEDGLSIVSYQHGTITLNADAPTEQAIRYKQPDADSVIFSSLGGFATLQADYIGYGDSSSHYHPYMLKKSLANSTIDLIEATRKFAQENDIELNEKLFLTGYSEGGYGTMATVQKLEELGNSVVASAPMAGDYDLDYIANSSLGLKEENLTGFSSAYFALTSLAYTKVYDKNISTVINKPYDSQIETLLDGKHSSSQIENALPKNNYGEEGLFRADFVEEYITNSESWFKKALIENSVYDWSLNSPMHIVHCEGDDEVPYAIAKNTYETMLSNGTKNLELITPDANEPKDKKWSHGECSFPATVHTVLWFVEMRDK